MNFCRLSRHFKREKSVFWNASFLQNKNRLRVYKTSRLVIISLLVSVITNGFVFFFSGKLIYKFKAIENFFPVFLYPDINTRGVGRFLDSYANPSGVYIRLCKQGKRFLLLK